MAELKLEFSQGENQYSDGDIESELLNLLKNNPDNENIINKDTRWPIYYHLSHLRENILNWYPFKKNAEVLEVGAGCGAITGILCEKTKHVTAVELTRRRAEINYQRNKDRDNLDIYVGDIFKIKLKKKFDYITVIGVLEYAALMSDDADPYSVFLQKIKKFLKPDGHILLAIENRFGLKYFAGAREDHTSRYFEGVNGYLNNETVKTFSKSELTELIDKNGLTSHRFYYPLPDYKFVSSVYTDESINKYDANIEIPSLDIQRYTIFNENKVMKDFAKDEILDRFSNSFFVDMANEGVECDKSIELVKISAVRDKKYRIATFIKNENGTLYALKAPLNEQTKPHLAEMVDFYNQNKTYHKLNLVKSHLNEDGSVYFELAKGKTLAKSAIDGYLQNGLGGLIPVLEKYHEIIFTGAKNTSDFYNDKFCEYFGDTKCKDTMLCISPADIDCGLDHIFEKDGQKTLIDYEWFTDFPVPADYLMWRALFYLDVPKLSHSDKTELFRHFNISTEMQKTFMNWEVNFIANKVKSVNRQGQSNFVLDINNIDPNTQAEIITSVSFDKGAGYDTEAAISKDVASFGMEAHMKVKIPKGVKSIRFDPSEGIPVQCRIVSAVCSGHILKLCAVNAIASENGNDYFLTLDPVYTANGSLKEGSTLEITFIISKLDTSIVDMAINKKFSELNNKIDELSKESVAYDKVVNSKSWKITAPLRKAMGAVKK